MIVSLIAAVAKNGVIGRDNGLPWRLADDMRHFVNTTRGHTVITGRKNYEAMGRALPKRRNIVVSRSTDFAALDAECAQTIEQALEMAEREGDSEVFVIGGGQIYALALPYAHRFYRTILDVPVDGDVFFPEFDETDFDRTLLFRHEADERNECGFSVELLNRTKPPRAFTTEAAGSRPKSGSADPLS
jgi:dihydrofolate reductase